MRPHQGRRWHNATTHAVLPAPTRRPRRRRAAVPSHDESSDDSLSSSDSSTDGTIDGEDEQSRNDDDVAMPDGPPDDDDGSQARSDSRTPSDAPSLSSPSGSPTPPEHDLTDDAPSSGSMDGLDLPAPPKTSSYDSSSSSSSSSSDDDNEEDHNPDPPDPEPTAEELRIQSLEAELAIANAQVTLTTDELEQARQTASTAAAELTNERAEHAGTRRERDTIQRSRRRRTWLLATVLGVVGAYGVWRWIHTPEFAYIRRRREVVYGRR